MKFWCLSHCRVMKAQVSLTNQSLHCLQTQSMDIDEDSGLNLDPYLCCVSTMSTWVFNSLRTGVVC